MRRRELLLIAMLGAGYFPQVLRAQPAKGKIGYLHPVTASRNHITFSVLEAEWRRLGYVEGETVLPLAANGELQQLPALVRQLTGKGVGVIIAVGYEAVRAAASGAPNTAIVAIDLETDPLQTGLIRSVARPGGNITGLFLDTPVLAAKWIQLMREMVPDLDRIVFAWQPSAGKSQLDVALRVAQNLRVETTVVEFGVNDDFPMLLSALAGPKRTGIIQLGGPGITTVAEKFVAAAVQHNLPTLSFLGEAARRGFLMSYGPNQKDYFPRAVQLADRILHGEKAAELPVERPSKFEFVVNLRTARALNLTVPPALLVRADEVIE
ncbi:ABC transporter substrate-binding protein [Bradyrhizobium sp. CNPSo 4010]|uniref:ABC transporter substrate-binding protein n=1 Tax=Bradyrhizobium agreste TaxID=2751811 RepID=A0ABS0PJW9_9BRAD|nr:ABC transporter substrate-binding protein [Bradyrhizobium agreste]MBH5397492.1 ABC transporter substrate-binding protein [Bradyrhizobium agreste]